MNQFRKNILFSFILLILWSFSTEAVTKKETSNGFTVTTTDNATRNGQSGFLFKVSMNVPGPDSSGAYLIVTFCDMNSNKIYVNGNALGTFGSITLPYRNNAFDNCELFISYNDLKKGNITPLSAFKYYFTVNSKGGKGQLKQSGWLTWNGNRSNGTNVSAKNTNTTSNNSRKSASYYLTVGFGNPKYGGGQWVGEGRNAKIFQIEYDNNSLYWVNTTYPRVKGKSFNYMKTTSDGSRVYEFKEVIGSGPIRLNTKYVFVISRDGKDLKYISYSDNEYSSANFATSDRNKLKTEIAKYRDGVTPVRIISTDDNNVRIESSKSTPSGKRKCQACNGSGHQKERLNQSDPHASTGKQASYYCERCGGWFATKHNHYVPTCPVCHGKGYVD